MGNVIYERSGMPGNRMVLYEEEGGNKRMLTPSEVVNRCIEYDEYFGREQVESCSEWFDREQSKLDQDRATVSWHLKEMPDAQLEGMDMDFEGRQKAIYNEYKNANSTLMGASNRVRGYLGHYGLVDGDCREHMLDTGMPYSVLEPKPDALDYARMAIGEGRKLTRTDKAEISAYIDQTVYDMADSERTAAFRSEVTAMQEDYGNDGRPYDHFGSICDYGAWQSLYDNNSEQLAESDVRWYAQEDMLGVRTLEPDALASYCRATSHAWSDEMRGYADKWLDEVTEHPEVRREYPTLTDIGRGIAYGEHSKQDIKDIIEFGEGGLHDLNTARAKAGYEVKVDEGVLFSAKTYDKHADLLVVPEGYNELKAKDAYMDLDGLMPEGTRKVLNAKVGPDQLKLTQQVLSDKADPRKVAALQGISSRSVQPGRELPSFDEICPGADSGKQSGLDGFTLY